MSDPDVDDPSPAVAAMAAPWPMIDALVGGTAAMRAAGENFLPKFPREAQESWEARRNTATLFPAFDRTTRVLAAKPFARPIDTGKNVPANVKSLLTDVDMLGTDLQPFFAQIMLTVMRYGLMGVLVDVPPAMGIRTLAEERSAGVRPYFTKYPPASILGWRFDRDPNGARLTQLRLYEEVLEPNGPWFDVVVPQVRVLTPGAWEVWRKVQNSAGGSSWQIHQSGTTTLKKVPFVFFYGIRKDFGIGEPPLLDLAFLNVEHWQSASDQQTILHVARVPILFAKGFQDGETITIGASSAAMSSSEKAELSYVEHTGAAIEAGRQSLTDLEDRMRQTGAELLVQQPAQATATQVTTESEGNRSTLQQIVEDFEESISDCLSLMGEWLGEKFKPEVQMFKDFGAANLSERSGDLLLRAAKDNHVSSETVFDHLKRADIIAPNLSWDDEQLRLAKQPRGAPQARNAASKESQDPTMGGE